MRRKDSDTYCQSDTYFKEARTLRESGWSISDVPTQGLGKICTSVASDEEVFIIKRRKIKPNARVDFEGLSDLINKIGLKYPEAMSELDIHFYIKRVEGQ